jgi:Tfp pilus assembly protein PilF
MADKETTIEYTPEELAEIERVLGTVERLHELTAPDSALVPEPPKTDEDELSDFSLGEPDDLDLPAGDLDSIGEPDDLNLPSGDLDSLVSDVQQGEDLNALMDDVSTDDIDTSFDETETEIEQPDDFDIDIKQEDLTDVDTEDIEDITDLIQEIDDIDPDQQGDAGLGDISDFDLDDLNDTPKDAETKAAGDGSTMDQLDALTSSEPESLDVQDISTDEFIGGADDQPGDDVEIDYSDAGDVQDLDMGDIDLDFDDSSAQVSLDSNEDDTDIPDLSDVSFDDAELPDADDSDIPDIDLSDLGDDNSSVKADAGSTMSELDNLDDALGGIDDIPDLGDDLEAIDDFDSGSSADMDSGITDDISSSSMDLDSDDSMDLMSDIDVEPLEIEPLDDIDSDDSYGTSGDSEGDENLELSDKELKKLKKAILLFNSGLRGAIKNTVVNDLLPLKDTRQMVNMILANRPEDNIHRFLEKKLGTKIQLVDEASVPGRRVITQRAEYTREGRERQKRLLKFTFIGVGVMLFLLAAGALTHRYIYRPYHAKSLVSDGVILITRRGTYIDKPKDYQKAEQIFKEVQDYMPNFIYGYNRYGEAYFDKKQYARSIEKLNRAYALDKTNVDTLNNLGYFYARLPKAEYGYYREHSEKYFPVEKKRQALRMKQIELAIHLYKRALLMDSKNVTAMRGIGDAYFHQKQYLKAEKYFKDIVKLDSKSTVGHAGLLNLYIERNSFARVTEEHATLKDKKLLVKMPSPLLGKLADYYLQKNRTDDLNVRVDYGLQSPRLKDRDDNTYPAVRQVLRTLSERDKEYPPLYFHLARINRQQKKYKIMKIQLQRALTFSKNNYGKDYFSARHLLGEYYYIMNQPVEAVDNLKKALDAVDNKPSFMNDDYYKETVSTGKTNAILGNVFYYFFDNVKYMYGSLRDRKLENNLEKMANFTIAKKYYGRAIKDNYSSSELHYNLGRIHYLNREYPAALNQWLNLYQDFVKRPELMVALGNAYYHTGNFDSSKGEFLKLASVLGFKADKINLAMTGVSDHQILFRTLSTAHNNLGVVYQKTGDESKSSIHYWKAIDFAKRVNVENEFARVNLARGFKRGQKDGPILDENIPYSIKYFREEMRN